MRWLGYVGGAAVAGSIALQAHALVLAENGAAKAAIVVDAKATPARRNAAEELARYLRKATGGAFKVQFAPEPGIPNLLVGAQCARSADPGFSVEGLGHDGIVIRTVGKDLVLAGGEPRGTLYAVYTFLEDHVGVRWWAPGAETVPTRPTLEVDNLDVRHVPVLETRGTSASRALDGDWSARSKLNGFQHRLESRHGGKADLYIAGAKWGCHTFWTVIPPRVYFRDHPEWYSLINGERTHKAPKYFASSLCLTNEELFREFVNNSRLALSWHPWATLYSISQVDDAGEPNRCMCGPCTKVEEVDGPSGLIIQFANRVIAELEKDFPEVDYSTLAYHYSQAPPRQTRPHDKLRIRLCSIGCSTSTPFSEGRDDNPRHNKFREDLLGWSKICNKLHVWDYVGNFTYLMLPHPNVRTFGPNIRFLIANNVKGLFSEDIARNRETAMQELRSWVLAKLMWDPTLDDRALIEEFVRGFYGPAGEDVLAYVNLIHDAVEKTGDYLDLSAPPDSEFLSLETLGRSWKILQDAEAAATGHPAYLARVQNPQRSVLYAFSVAYERLRKEAEETGAEWPVPESLLAITDLLYPPGPSVVMTLGERWQFRTDPSGAGLEEEWYGADENGDWVPISVLKDWTSQGHDYHGAAWYRTEFTLPDNLDDAGALRLRFGAIDGDADVFLDGRRIAELTGHPWDQPVEVALPADLARAPKHRLAVKVTKYDFAAGLWKPVRIVR